MSGDGDTAEGSRVVSSYLHQADKKSVATQNRIQAHAFVTQNDTPGAPSASSPRNPRSNHLKSNEFLVAGEGLEPPTRGL
jgi:DUF917 family protein